MWKARTKAELIIEVWEWLDCEDVGAAEIESIKTELLARFGKGSVDSPMHIARLLADEGAQLRHDEVMELYVSRVTNRPYDAALSDVLKLDRLQTTLSTIRRLEALRQKYSKESDKEGIRLVRETALQGKQLALETSSRELIDPAVRQAAVEIANWLTVWLQTPAAFEDWVELRMRSDEFAETLGKIETVRL